MTVLVTGATGFVGQHVVRRLAGADDVAVFARDPDLATQMFGDAVTVVPGDFRDASGVERALNGVDVLYHIGARRDHWGLPYREYYESNVIGTRNLMQAAQRAGTPKIVYCSTVGVYGFDFQYFPVDEAHPYGHNLSYYHKSKMLAERAVAEFKDLPVITVRPGWIYGPNDEWGGVTQMLIKLARGRFAFAGSGANSLHPVHIDDITDGILAAGRSEQYGEVFLLLGPEHITFRGYVEAMCRALGVDPPRFTVPYLAALAASFVLEPAWLVKNRVVGKKMLGDKPPMTRDTLHGVTAHRFYTTEKGTRLLGHTPRVSIADGLAGTVRWLAGTGRLHAPVAERILRESSHASV